MENIQLGYGDEIVEINISNAKSVKFLHGKNMPTIFNVSESLIKSLTEEIIDSKSITELINKEDKVTIIISDITRYWMRQDLVCEALVDYLHDVLHVPYESIMVIVAVGTHRMQTEAELEKMASTRVYQNCTVINHDCDSKDLVYVGTTSFNTRVEVSPYVVDRKVILIGGTVHHVMAGYGGGRKSILPGVSSRETIKQNHIHALDEVLPQSSQYVGVHKTIDNPIHLDMAEAARFVNPCLGINIVVNTESKHCKFFSGNFETAWELSCQYIQENYGYDIDYEADIVIASCGGFPKDINLYQGVKTLFNSTRAVKKGGTLIFIAKCNEGGGSDDFFSWMGPLQQGILDETLRNNFTIGGYIFYAACEQIRKANVKMLSVIDQNVVKDMNIESYSDINQLLQTVDFKDKSIYVIPFGGNVVPFLK